MYILTLVLLFIGIVSPLKYLEACLWLSYSGRRLPQEPSSTLRLFYKSTLPEGQYIRNILISQWFHSKQSNKLMVLFETLAKNSKRGFRSRLAIKIDGSRDLYPLLFGRCIPPRLVKRSKRFAREGSISEDIPTNIRDQKN